MAKQTQKVVEFKQEKSDKSKPGPAKRSENLGFLHVPRPVLYNKNLSLSAFRVACFLYDHLAPRGNLATGSLDTIANDLGIGRYTVQRAIRELFRYHIIMSVTKQENSRGGYYNEYTMRVYDYPKLRASPILTYTKKPESDAEKLAKKLCKKAKNDTSNSVEPSHTIQCNTCRDTRWVQVEGQRASKRCPNCLIRQKK